MNTKHFQTITLTNLDMPFKVLFTGYLLAIGIGLAVAGMQILLTHGMADGKFGLSLDDVVYSYHGNRENSKLETKLKGSMQDKAPAAVKNAMILWARKGADKTQWDQTIGPMFQEHCIKCHGVIPALPDFNHYEAAKEVAKVDTGATIDSLTRVSHIHIFGISFIFFFVGLIFAFATGVPAWLKLTCIAAPFAFLILDVFSWWLTKLHPAFAWLTIIAGLGYTAASTIMWFTSMYQMWSDCLRKTLRKRQVPDNSQLPVDRVQFDLGRLDE